MKSTIVTLILALAMPGIANAYLETNGSDPSAYPDVEKKAVALPSASASTIAVGLVLTYNPASIDGYTVTNWSGPTSLQQRLIACISTGTVIASAGAYSLCVTKGYVNGVSYDTTGALAGNTQQIFRGDNLCVNGGGKLTSCYAGTTPAIASSSKIIALDPAPALSTGTIRVLIDSQ